LEKAGRLAEAEATYAAGPDPTAMAGRSSEEEIEAFLRRWRSAAADQAQPVRGVPRAFLGTSVHANVAGRC
jgi:hypothetical protein